MSLLNFLGISDALADTTTTLATQQHPPGFLSMMWLPLLLIVVFYFLLIRPQSKRAKEHRNLLQNLSVGDEVSTAGGMLAKVVKLKDNFVVIEISQGVQMTLQKASIATILPKGTIDSI